MQADFWHERWSHNQIGFHESTANPLLVAHFATLGLSPGARIFVPLCGKTLDIDWLLSLGFRVAGSELSPLAVAQLFERLGGESTSTRAGELTQRSTGGLDVFVGDFFGLSRAQLGLVDAVYDRAALIALPLDMRRRYTEHLSALTNGAPQLLIALEYEQQGRDGPPFSVDAAEVQALYGGREPTLLTAQAIPGGLKGEIPATEKVWLLRGDKAVRSHLSI